MYRNVTIITLCFFLLLPLGACFRTASPAPTDDLPLDATAGLLVSTSPGNNRRGIAPAAKIRVTFSESMNQAASGQAVNIFVGKYSPSTNPTSFGAPSLTAICNGKWKVQNTNASQLSFTWDVQNSTEKGVGVVPANGETFFYTSKGSKTVRLFVNSVQQQAKASVATACASQEWSLSWSTDGKALTVTPAKALLEKTNYTVVLSTATSNSSGSVKLTNPYVFSFRTDVDPSKYLDPSITGTERTAMLKVISSLPPEYRSNIVYTTNSGAVYSNRPYLRNSYLPGYASPSFMAPSSENATFDEPVSSEEFFPFEDAVNSATNFYASIEAQGIGPQTPPLDCKPEGNIETGRTEGGPYTMAVTKPGSGLANQTFTGTRLVNEQTGQTETVSGVKVSSLKYLKATVYFPSRDQKLSGEEIKMNETNGYFCPNESTPEQNEIPHLYIGAWGSGSGGQRVEGGLQWNCDKDNWSVFYLRQGDIGSVSHGGRIKSGTWADVEFFITSPMDGTASGYNNNSVVVAVTGNYDYFVAVKDIPGTNIKSGQLITCEQAPGCTKLPDGRIRVVHIAPSMPTFNPLVNNDPNGDASDITLSVSTSIAQTVENFTTGAIFKGMRIKDVQVAECEDWGRCARITWDISAHNSPIAFDTRSPCKSAQGVKEPSKQSDGSLLFSYNLCKTGQCPPEIKVEVGGIVLTERVEQAVGRRSSCSQFYVTTPIKVTVAGETVTKVEAFYIRSADSVGGYWIGSSSGPGEITKTFNIYQDSYRLEVTVDANGQSYEYIYLFAIGRPPHYCAAPDDTTHSYAIGFDVNHYRNGNLTGTSFYTVIESPDYPAIGTADFSVKPVSVGANEYAPEKIFKAWGPPAGFKYRGQAFGYRDGYVGVDQFGRAVYCQGFWWRPSIDWLKDKVSFDLKENSSDTTYDEIDRAYCVDLLPYE
jgi:Bacterial Ig-like domain